jgi:hypothetical protein
MLLGETKATCNEFGHIGGFPNRISIEGINLFDFMQKHNKQMIFIYRNVNHYTQVSIKFFQYFNCSFISNPYLTFSTFSYKTTQMLNPVLFKNVDISRKQN